MNNMEHSKVDIGKVIWRFFGAFILYILLVAAALWWFGVPVKAHEATHDHGPVWQYDKDCCSNNDCERVASAEVNPVDGRVYYQTKFGRKAVGDTTKIRPSGDQYTHACIVDWWTEVYCLYVPGGN